MFRFNNRLMICLNLEDFCVNSQIFMNFRIVLSQKLVAGELREDFGDYFRDASFMFWDRILGKWRKWNICQFPINPLFPPNSIMTVLEKPKITTPELRIGNILIFEEWYYPGNYFRVFYCNWDVLLVNGFPIHPG